jgi:hypothetical protein
MHEQVALEACIPCPTVDTRVVSVQLNAADTIAEQYKFLDVEVDLAAISAQFQNVRLALKSSTLKKATSCFEFTVLSSVHTTK